jgi:Zinc carboxypeptidase
MLDLDSILAPPVPAAAAPTSPPAQPLGRSRQGRPLLGYCFGRGPRHLSLIAGCHADEPVGPAMLDRLVAHLSRLPEESALFESTSWWIVPHANPDGEERNRTWTAGLFAGDLDGAAVDLGRYLRHAVREPPGDDVEFGFPRHRGDSGARPENRAVADFLRPGAPFALHASFHGMAFAAGPWFLLERGWAERTAAMRERLRQRVRELGYRLHDVDRGGEKGFHRIDEGFTSRPDSRAMAAHFAALGDPATAGLFRPSSMEFVRSLGGDPLTLVSEMPLFLVPGELYRGAEPVTPPAIGELRATALGGDPGALAARSGELGVRPMPVADQMRLQLEYFAAALDAVGDGGRG